MKLGHKLPLALLVAAASQLASAGTFIGNWTYELDAFTLKYSTNLPGHNGTRSDKTHQFHATRTGGTDTLAPDKIITYCVEVGEHIKEGKNTHSNVSHLLGSTTNLGGIAGPVYFDAVRTERMEKLWGTFFSAIGTDSLKSAAFQLATWEIAFDDDLTLGNNKGKLWVKSSQFQAGVTDVAEGWLTAIRNGDAQTRVGMLLLSGEGIQDQVTMVPEPASMIALGAGLAAIARKRRRK
jgi:hypothetical protein